MVSYSLIKQHVIFASSRYSLFLTLFEKKI
nr:MAG TPA: hypothetical protein [Caudoviricetes sp.]